MILSIFIALFFAVVSFLGACFYREFKWAAAVIKWENDRFELIRDVFDAANVLVNKTGIADVIVDGPGGNAMMSGTLLNYQALKDMVSSMQVIEEARLTVARELAGSLGKVLAWQDDNPQPLPPVVFKRRLAIPI